MRSLSIFSSSEKRRVVAPKGMAKSTQISLALKKFQTWYQSQARVLPWRSRPTLYRVWISEMMLQQTQVATVIPYFDRFMERFPTVESLARAREQTVLKYWQGLGYYSRARYIHRAAKTIYFERGGEFPKSLEDWMELPGVGRYTGGAIVSIALNQTMPVLDGNVERVLSRMFCWPVNKTKMWWVAQRAVDRAACKEFFPRDFNQAMMELGATICTFKSPQCRGCPVASICRAKRSGRQSEYPPKKPRKAWIVVEESADAWVDSKKRVYLVQAGAKDWRQGLWDLPLREVRRDAKTGARFDHQVTTRHIVTRHRITRSTQIHQIDSGSRSRSLKLPQGKWVSLADCLNGQSPVPIGRAAQKTLQAIFEKIES